MGKKKLKKKFKRLKKKLELINENVMGITNLLRHVDELVNEQINP